MAPAQQSAAVEPGAPDGWPPVLHSWGLCACVDWFRRAPCRVDTLPWPGDAGPACRGARDTHRTVQPTPRRHASPRDAPTPPGRGYSTPSPAAGLVRDTAAACMFIHG